VVSAWRYAKVKPGFEDDVLAAAVGGLFPNQFLDELSTGHYGGAEKARGVQGSCPGGGATLCLGPSVRGQFRLRA